MYVIKLLSAAIFATAAFAMDLHRQKVANVWIMAGWIWGWCLQYAAREWDGVLQFFAGSSIPIVCLFPLFYFRMLGAGDIKLLSVLGGLLGARAAFHLMFLSFFFGGILSLGLLVSSGTLMVRLRYFADYFRIYVKNRERRPYRQTGEQAENFHFTLPVLLGVFLYIGGIC